MKGNRKQSPILSSHLNLEYETSQPNIQEVGQDKTQMLNGRSGDRLSAPCQCSTGRKPAKLYDVDIIGASRLAMTLADAQILNTAISIGGAVPLGATTEDFMKGF